MEAVAATAASTDDALAARVQSGDRQALAALYESHFHGIFDFALRIVRRCATAAAVVRKTFSSIVR
jgi:DNA-directed RNA polymerase specialized sigma24 family protein